MSRPTVTLRFKTEVAREAFMAWLNEQDACQLFWTSNRSFKRCDEFDVTVLAPEGGEVL